MKNFRLFFRLMSLTIFSLALFTGCSEENTDLIEDAPFNVKIGISNEFGNVLVNQNNQAMYFFANDVTGGESNCNGGCAEAWPPVLREVSELNLSSYLNEADFGMITREDGQRQLAFKGWPLYYFSPNRDGELEEPGQFLGDGVGGVWYVAKPDYTVMVGNQPLVGGGDPEIYLVDDRGVSLYLNTADGNNISNCSGGCANVWPPFKGGELVVPSLLKSNEFVKLERGDNLGPQLSFKGSPLYYFTPDEQKQGILLGQGGGPNETFFAIGLEL